MKSITEMSARIRSSESLQFILNEMVIDHYVHLAHIKNNEGPEAQLKWLKEACGQDLDILYNILCDAE